jgi:hypothetical protein
MISAVRSPGLVRSIWAGEGPRSSPSPPQKGVEARWCAPSRPSISGSGLITRAAGIADAPACPRPRWGQYRSAQNREHPTAADSSHERIRPDLSASGGSGLLS